MFNVMIQPPRLWQTKYHGINISKTGTWPEEYRVKSTWKFSQQQHVVSSHRKRTSCTPQKKHRKAKSNGQDKHQVLAANWSSF
jgi:hypothetical protein